jgi:hypothetical protein
MESNSSNTTNQIQPISYIKKAFRLIYKGVPIMISWSFNCIFLNNNFIYNLVILFIGFPLMLEISNQNLYQWIKRNGGFKSESINSMEMRSLI